MLSSILVLGSQILALTDDGRNLLVWDTEAGELISTIIFQEGFTAKHVIHPATLLNKVLVSSQEGGMQLWNIKTRYQLDILALWMHVTKGFTGIVSTISPLQICCQDTQKYQPLPLSSSPMWPMSLALVSHLGLFLSMTSESTNKCCKFAWKEVRQQQWRFGRTGTKSLPLVALLETSLFGI